MGRSELEAVTWQGGRLVLLVSPYLIPDFLGAFADKFSHADAARFGCGGDFCVFGVSPSHKVWLVIWSFVHVDILHQ